VKIVVDLGIEEIESSAEKLGVKLRAGDVHEIRQNASLLIADKLQQLGMEMLDSCTVAYAVMSGLPVEKPVADELMKTIREVEEEDRKINGVRGN